MAFEHYKDVPIHSIDTVIEVVAKGSGEQELDEVMVTSNIELANEVGEEMLLLLPLASSAQRQPILRYVEEHVKTAIDFEVDAVERSELDAELVERLEKLANGTSKKEEKEVLTQIKRCADAISAAVVRVAPGQKRLRLFYEIAAPKVDAGFEFEVMGPLPSFFLAPGGSISVVALLPRGTTLVSAVGLQNPDDAGSAIPEKTEQQLGRRQAIGWYWQFDPLFKVRYQY